MLSAVVLTRKTDIFLAALLRPHALDCVAVASLGRVNPHASLRKHAADDVIIKTYGASLYLHVTTLTLSLILTLRLTLILQPYPNPTNPNSTDPKYADPNPKP